MLLLIAILCKFLFISGFLEKQGPVLIFKCYMPCDDAVTTPLPPTSTIDIQSLNQLKPHFRQ